MLAEICIVDTKQVQVKPLLRKNEEAKGVGVSLSSLIPQNKKAYVQVADDKSATQGSNCYTEIDSIEDHPPKQQSLNSLEIGKSTLN